MENSSTPSGPARAERAELVALQNSAESYRLLVESAQEYAIFMIDPAGRIATWNSGAERIFRYTEQEAIGRSSAVIFVEEDRAAGVPEAEMAKAADTGQATDERWHLRKDGARFWASGVMEVLRRPDGHVQGFVKLLRDNTEQKLAAEALRKSEERYRTLFESIDEGFCIIEMLFNAHGEPVDYRFLETNPAFERHTGLHNVVGQQMRALAPLHEEHWFQIYGRIAQTGAPARFIEKATFLGNRWYDVYAFRIDGPEEHKVAVLFSDITLRKQAEMALSQLNDSLEDQVAERSKQIHDLVSQLILSEQSVRHRLSTLLHDDLQQRLYSFQYQIMLLSDLLGAEAHADAGRIIRHFEEEVALSIQLTRRLSIELSPPLLEGEGLPEALDWLATHMKRQHGLTLHVQAADKLPRLQTELRVLLYQIVCESLFNVVKHAGVKVATVSLSQTNGSLQIEIIDRGVGFDAAVILDGSRQTFGLWQNQRRLELIGGQMQIESSPGNGTHIIITCSPPADEG